MPTRRQTALGSVRLAMGKRELGCEGDDVVFWGVECGDDGAGYGLQGRGCEVASEQLRATTADNHMCQPCCGVRGSACSSSATKGRSLRMCMSNGAAGS